MFTKHIQASLKQLAKALGRRKALFQGFTDCAAHAFALTLRNRRQAV
jgi:hypothetical protein